MSGGLKDREDVLGVQSLEARCVTCRVEEFGRSVEGSTAEWGNAVVLAKGHNFNVNNNNSNNNGVEFVA